MSRSRTKAETNEHELAEAAASRLASEAKTAPDPTTPQPGQPLPEGFENAPIGAPRGHYCLDTRGRYQPDWYALKLHKTSDNMPHRQYFNMNGKGWYVEVGVWVDVPPQIVTILGYTEQQVISMDVTSQALMSERGATKVVDVVPRFSYTFVPSA